MSNSIIIRLVYKHGRKSSVFLHKTSDGDANWRTDAEILTVVPFIRLAVSFISKTDKGGARYPMQQLAFLRADREEGFPTLGDIPGLVNFGFYNNYAKTEALWRRTHEGAPRLWERLSRDNWSVNLAGDY